MRFRCTSAEGTLGAARVLAGCVSDNGLLVGLIGPLGAGKTAFVKGLADGLGVDPETVVGRGRDQDRPGAREAYLFREAHPVIKRSKQSV